MGIFDRFRKKKKATAKKDKPKREKQKKPVKGKSERKPTRKILKKNEFGPLKGSQENLPAVITDLQKEMTLFREELKRVYDDRIKEALKLVNQQTEQHKEDLVRIRELEKTVDRKNESLNESKQKIRDLQTLERTNSNDVSKVLREPLVAEKKILKLLQTSNVHMDRFSIAQRIGRSDTRTNDLLNALIKSNKVIRDTSKKRYFYTAVRSEANNQHGA